MGDRRLGVLTASLLLSVLIHGLGLGLPGWTPPGATENPPEEALRATLVAPPRPAVAAPPAPAVAKPVRPARPPKPRPPILPPAARATLPAVEEPVPDPVPEPTQAAAEPPTMPESTPESVPAPPPPEAPPPPAPLPAGGPSWPREGRIIYDVFRGDRDFLVGRTTHSWEQDGRRYRMKTVVETVGLVALMKSFRYVQESEGRVTARGLMPETFRAEQEGRRAEGAQFDWAAGEVVVRRAKGPERRAAVRPGDQDVLSIWHQLALMGEPPPHLRLTLVSNKAATPAELETLGVDGLDLPLGHVAAHHLRARALDGSLSLDVWLAEKYGYLPVRVRIQDRQDETFDQRAREIFRGETREGGAEAPAPEENKTHEHPDGTP